MTVRDSIPAEEMKCTIENVAKKIASFINKEKDNISMHG